MSTSLISTRLLEPGTFSTVATRALSTRAKLSPSCEHAAIFIRTFATKKNVKAKHSTVIDQKSTSFKNRKSAQTSNMSKRSSYERSELGHPSTKRAKQIDQDQPFDNLTKLLGEQEEKEEVTKVVHWFRPKDLRIHDNTALHHASHLAQSSKKPLICIYLHCPAEESWHGTSPARMDFMIQGLRLMQDELKELNIPLVFLHSQERKDCIPMVASFLKDNQVSHIFANFEYEFDEIRRDIGLVREVGSDVQVSIYHDQTVVEPGSMLTGGGKPMKVFTPYHRSWLNRVKEEPSLLDTQPAPAKNVAPTIKGIKSLFSSEPPEVAEDKQFTSTEDKKRIRKLWPAGHAAGMERVDSFLSTIHNYAATRSNPAADSTSRMSAYFSAGMVSVREALSKIRRYNKGSSDFSEGGSSHGVYSWVREIVFRELYRQTLMKTPHTAMNLPQNLKFDFVKWEDDETGWEKWYKGKTGEPFIDAGMRQLNTEAYMHNRLRMNVSSYLYCNLLLDYRRGERYFAETLIDWDLSNNTQGWEPSYTVFNPVSQAEKNDPNGEYIRRCKFPQSKAL
jgi:deoxyribodipyrimidine photo-lyase